MMNTTTLPLYYMQRPAAYDPPSSCSTKNNYTHSRDLSGKGAEGLCKAECLCEHGHSQSQHGHCSQGQGGGDDAHNGTGKDGQQVPEG